ncbi:MAG: GTPase Era [Burkholderiales bacterium]|nr:GTPase Era [Burkholderiales bacterium]
MSESPPQHRAGMVAIIGQPNVGKSTLLNRLVGQKVSITSRKPQTTRHRITGVVTRPDAQVVFVDTPGFQTRHGGALNQALNRAVTESVSGVDAAVLMVEAGRFGDRDRSVLRLLPDDVPTILAINKIDALKDKTTLLPFVDTVRREREFVAVIPLSAETGDQCDALLDEIVRLLPENAPLFDEDQVTDRSERFLAAELVREKIFRLTGDELPYAVEVVVETFETEGDKRHIRCLIVVGRTGHKAMIIGAGGAKLKAIATEARLDMERMFGGRVFLELWVKVDRDWAENPRALRRYGYN